MRCIRVYKCSTVLTLDTKASHVLVYTAAMNLKTFIGAWWRVCMIDWLYIALRFVQEYFSHIWTSPLPVKGCKIQSSARCLLPLSRTASLSSFTCWDIGPRFRRSHPKDCLSVVRRLCSRRLFTFSSFFLNHQTWHNEFFGKGDLSLFNWRVRLFSKGR